MSSSGTGYRISSELAICVFGGTIGGYFLDKWLETKPLFMILLFFAGTALAFYNIYRISEAEEKSSNPLQNLEKDAKKGPEKPDKD